MGGRSDDGRGREARKVGAIFSKYPLLYVLECELVRHVFRPNSDSAASGNGRCRRTPIHLGPFDVPAGPNFIRPFALDIAPI